MVIAVFVLKFTNKFTVTVTFLFLKIFNKMFIFVGERHDFTAVNITSPGKHTHSKYTSMISIHLQCCTPKSRRPVHICKLL